MESKWLAAVPGALRVCSYRYTHGISFKNHYQLAGYGCIHLLVMETAGKALGLDIRLPGYSSNRRFLFWTIPFLLGLRKTYSTTYNQAFYVVVLGGRPTAS
jgi:hypothetical protein